MLRTETFFCRANVLRGLFLGIVVALGYFIPNHYVIFPTHSVLLTRIDHLIALSPAWIWFYIAYYPFLVAAYLYATGTPAQKAYVGSMLLSACVGFIVFVFFPTAIPRDIYPWLGADDTSARMLASIRGADNSVNCLPSMHVCMSFIAASTFTLVCGWRGRAVAWALFLAICYSTMATKQHYFVDVAAGMGLGLTVVSIMLKRYSLLPDFLTEDSPTQQRP